MQDQTTPLITVIIPTFNRVAYLKTALTSVFDQTMSNWEALVIDDGSTDGTGEYVSGLNDDRVKLFTMDHCGVPAQVRNVGIVNARGRYIAFLDSDDMWAPNKLERQTSLLAERKTALWSYTHFTRIDGQGKQLSDKAIKKWQPYSGAILHELITIDAIIAMPTVMVATQLLTQAGPFDPELVYCEDYDLWFRLAVKGEALAIPERLSFVRVSPDSYVRDRAAVHRSWIATYGKLARTGDASVRRLCEQQTGHSMVALAKLYSASGRIRPAAAEMVRSFGRHPTSSRWWRELPKTVPRAVMSKMGLLRTRGAD